MERKHFDFSVFAVAIIIIAILFSACSIEKNVDPNGGTTKPNENTDISTTESTTNENVSNSENDNKDDEVYEYYQCFVVGEEEYAVKNNLTPGYLYFHEDWDSEIKLLLAKKMKIDVADFKNSVYGITEDNEIIEVNKTDGSYKSVYTAKYGSIDYLSNVVCVNRYIYFNDGKYIVELDPITNECVEKIKCDKKIAAIYPGGDIMVVNELSIYCDICGPEGEYFLYTVGSEDEGYESYWHHPETGKDELIDINYVFTYGGDFKEEYNHLGWKVEK